MICPRCAKFVDQTGTEWVQLCVEKPFKWEPICHRDCAMETIREMSGKGIRLKEIEVKTQVKPKMRTTAMVGRKRK